MPDCASHPQVPELQGDHPAEKLGIAHMACCRTQTGLHKIDRGCLEALTVTAMKLIAQDESWEPQYDSPDVVKEQCKREKLELAMDRIRSKYVASSISTAAADYMTARRKEQQNHEESLDIEGYLIQENYSKLYSETKAMQIVFAF